MRTLRKIRLSAAVTLLCALVLGGLAVTGAQQQGGGGQQPAGQSPAAGQNGQPAAPTPGPTSPQQPTFRGGIDVVRVDAFVTDKKGQPVTDLKETDFEVLEDGKPQTVDQFKTIRIDGTPITNDEVRPIRNASDEEQEAQRDDVRLFVFFLDDYHTRDRNAIAVRETLIKFVDTQLRPTDMVAIMYPLQPSEDVTFTRDHDKIANALSHFEGRKYNYEPRNAYEQIYERMSTVDIEKLRNQIVQGALEGLAVRLGGLRDARKSVIFVSEGFTVVLPPEMRRNNSQAPQLTSAARVESVEQDAEIKGQMELDLRMRDVYRAANRFNMSIYSLDPRGLTPFEFDISDGSIGGVSQASDRQMLRSTQDTLRALSEETDGRAILNRNTLGEGLAQIVKDQSFYYLLGYNTQAPNDGKFHEIKVRVKRPGVDVRARRGWWAFTAEMVTKLEGPRTPDLPKPMTAALAALASPIQAQRYVRTWVGTEQGANGKTRVTVVWEPLPTSVASRREPVGRITLLAATDKGDLVFRGRSTDAPASAAPTPAAPAAAAGAPPASQRLVFEAPPGKLDLRVTIEAAGGGTIDQEARTVDVPDLTSPSAALSTPRVFRARTARDFQQVSQDPAAMPVASREFSRTERLLIRFDAYGANGDKPSATAAVVNKSGQKLSDVPVSPAPIGGTHQIDLGLNTMAAGEYLLEITVKGTTGEPAKEYIAFRIGA